MAQIPKVIHYCWFGGNPLPNLAIKCIESWKRFFPDYEIIEWNESNFDITINKYVHDAYLNKKYAFVSDYARFWILFHYGGIYFDTDVEVIRDFSPILSAGGFMGVEDHSYSKIAPGLGVGAYPKNPLINDIMHLYDNLEFVYQDGSLNLKTVVSYTTEEFEKYGFKSGINEPMQVIAGFFIYKMDFFCPLDYNTNELNITSNTFSIHHYLASWHSNKQKIVHYACLIFNKRLIDIAVNIKSNFINILKR